MVVKRRSRWRAFLPAIPFTVTGRLLGLASASALFVVINSSLALLLSLLFWLIVTSFLCGLAFRPRLKVSINSEDLRILGEQSRLLVTVKNIGSLPAYDLYLRFSQSRSPLQIESQPKYIAALDPGEQIKIDFSLQAIARGEHLPPSLQIESLFPFGMFRFVSQENFDNPILVAPSFHIRSMEDLLGNEVEATTDSSHSLLRKEFEYIGSVGYREGMQVRRWDFAAWARLGSPAIREFSEVRHAAAMVIVDASKVNTSVDQDEFEQLLSRSASACASLVQQNYSVQFVVIGNAVAVVDTHNERDALDILLRALAKVQGVKKEVSWEKAWDQIQSLLTTNAVLFLFLRTEEARSILPLAASLPMKIVADLPTATASDSPIRTPHFGRVSCEKGNAGV